jgi:hypothetical protein
LDLLGPLRRVSGLLLHPSPLPRLRLAQGTSPTRRHRLDHPILRTSPSRSLGPRLGAKVIGATSPPRRRRRAGPPLPHPPPQKTAATKTRGCPVARVGFCDKAADG